MRPQPAPQVVAWLDGQAAQTLYISAVTLAEIELGLALMPAGKRQAGLAAAARTMFEEDFGRCLAFDAESASHYARIVAMRTYGRPISVEDAQIAAIALAQDTAGNPQHGRFRAHRRTAVDRPVERRLSLWGCRATSPSASQRTSSYTWARGSCRPTLARSMACSPSSGYSDQRSGAPGAVGSRRYSSARGCL